MRGRRWFFTTWKPIGSKVWQAWIVLMKVRLKYVICFITLHIIPWCSLDLFCYRLTLLYCVILHLPQIQLLLPIVYVSKLYLLIYATVCGADCLSPARQCCFKMTRWIQLGYDIQASFHLFHIVLKENSSISNNKGISLWNIVTNSGFTKLCMLIMAMYYQYSLSKVDAHRDKLSYHQFTKLTIGLPAIDNRLLYSVSILIYG